MIKKSVLDNGLRVVSKNLPGTEAVTVLVLVGAGSRYENREINGISHFLEHMFFKGAKKYTNTREVSEVIDGVGGDFNAFTGKEYAGYYVKLGGENLGLALDVLADMLIDARFDPEEIEKERGVILEEYNMYQDTPMYQIGWDFEKMIFGDQPLGWDQVGTKELIKSISQKQFKDYFKALYTPANSVLVVAGKVPNHDAVVKQVEELFKFKNTEKTLEMADFEGFTSEEKIVLRDKKTEQAHVMLGVPGYAEDDERSYAAKLLAIIMGGNMSSRLFLGVREAHGLAYYISSTTDEYIDAGTFSVSAGVSLERIDLAISSIVAELAKVAKEGVDAAELEKAKKYYSGKIKLRLEDSEEYAHLLGKYELLEGEYVEPAELLKKIEGVTLEQVNEAARDLLREEELRLCVIGPFSDQERFAKLLKF